MTTLFENFQAFFLGKKEDPKEIEVSSNDLSFEKPIDPDGGLVTAAGIHSTMFDVSNAKNDRELIEIYRNVARIPEVNEAIDEIVNEMLSKDDEDRIIQLDTENVELPEVIKKKLAEEFQEILEIMDFDSRGHEILKRWYVDGRIAFHKIVDKQKLSNGIKELRYINPLSLEKIVEYDVVKEGGISLYKTSKEYFKYTPGNKTNTISLKTKGNNNSNNGSSMSFSSSNFWSTGDGVNLYGNNQVLAISPDAIAYCTSGNFDEDFGCVTSYLHPAIKPANNLTLVEDAMVIYRLIKSVERRIFYVDIGNLGKVKGDQYMNELMSKFKTQLSYDTTTGSIKGGARFQSMMEDFWIPRRENGRATEITTLPGGQNLSQLDDIEYVLKKLYSALKIPSSRFNKDQPMIAGIGRSSEITRDELRFQKFIDRLRAKFCKIFLDILGTQVVIKKIMDKTEWEEIKNNLQFKWAKDSFFVEMKESELLRERLTTLQMADPYIGKFFTQDYILKSILKVPEDELNSLKKELEQANKDEQEQEYDNAIQQNDIAVDKADKMAAVQQKYAEEE